MYGVAEVCFMGFCLLYVLLVGQDRLQPVLFQNVVDGYPVISGRLHADILDAIAFYPASYVPDIAVCRSELADIKDGTNRMKVSFADGCHKDRLVDINVYVDRAFDISNKRSDNPHPVVKDGRFKLLGEIVFSGNVLLMEPFSKHAMRSSFLKEKGL